MNRLLFLGAACWIISGALVINEPTHFEHNYSAAQLRAMEDLVNTAASGEPDQEPVAADDHIRDATKLVLVHPKTKRERAELIAMIWTPELLEKR